MKSRRVAVGLMVAALAFALGGSPPPCSVVDAVAPGPGLERATFVYTSDERSELFPCTCERTDGGGLAQRAAAFHRIEAERGALFVCSVGDVFDYKPGKADPHLRELKAAAVAHALGVTGYDVIGLGEMDLAHGAAFLQRMATTYGLTFVCANAFDVVGRRLFEPYVILEKDGTRVAFLGVVSPSVVGVADSKLLEHKISLRDPVTEIEKVLPDARAAADLVVLLAHSGHMDSEALLRVLDVDIVLVGHNPAIESRPRPLGHKVFATAGGKVDRFGTLDVLVKADGRGVEAVAGHAERLVKTDAVDPAVEEIVREATEREDQLRKERGLPPQDSPEEDAEEGPHAGRADGGVLGAESCRKCHAEIYDRWLATPHARAIGSLAETDDWTNLNCIGCHTTMGDRKPPVTGELDPRFFNVQCESCHGSGLGHAEDGTYVTKGEAACRKCHDAQNSPKFDYATYRVRGVH
jgi:2',3'-cyclic-nucleotide 2'-phosphodiesterase (5'-nucleotidase family)